MKHSVSMFACFLLSHLYGALDDSNAIRALFKDNIEKRSLPAFKKHRSLLQQLDYDHIDELKNVCHAYYDALTIIEKFRKYPEIEFELRKIGNSSNQKMGHICLRYILAYFNSSINHTHERALEIERLAQQRPLLKDAIRALMKEFYHHSNDDVFAKVPTEKKYIRQMYTMLQWQKIEMNGLKQKQSWAIAECNALVTDEL